MTTQQGHNNKPLLSSFRTVFFTDLESSIFKGLMDTGYGIKPGMKKLNEAAVKVLLENISYSSS